MRPHGSVSTLCAAAILAALSVAVPALAAEPTAPAANSAEQADLAKIQSYFNSLTTAQADFTLVAADGQTSGGQFYLNRPNKLRFEYTEPKGNLLIADGDYVIYWDARQKDASNLPISQTPLAFLLRPTVSLTDGTRISSYEHAAGVIRVQLVDAKSPDQGSVTIAFADQPIELRGWRLTDGQGQTTDVTFSNWKFGMSLASSLFHFEEPHSGKRGR
jgi:outer membrane lipoprotein-sorting protein